MFPFLIYVLYFFGLHAVGFSSFHFLVCGFSNQFGVFQLVQFFFQLVRVFIAYVDLF